MDETDREPVAVDRGRAFKGWLLAVALTFGSPIVAAASAVALMLPYGDTAAGWPIFFGFGIVAAFGPACGAMVGFEYESLATKTGFAAAFSIAGPAAYTVLFVYLLRVVISGMNAE